MQSASTGSHRWWAPTSMCSTPKKRFNFAWPTGTQAHHSGRRRPGAVVGADRDHPPFERSGGHGRAVRAAGARGPDGKLEWIGEMRAGGTFRGNLGGGQCVEMVTGASVPPRARAVVMIEHAKR